MSKLSEKLFSLVRQRQQRGGDPLPAKVERRPAAVGMYGEDMTETMAWCLRYAGSDPAGAWDLYKRKAGIEHAAVENRIGGEPPVRVSVSDMEMTRWAIMIHGRLVQMAVTHMTREQMQALWPGYEIVGVDELPSHLKRIYAIS